MNDVDPDVHADFNEMVTVQLARKDTKIRELETELQRLKSAAGGPVSPIGQPTPDVLPSPPTLILPPSATWRRATANPPKAELAVLETPPLAEERPGQEETVMAENENKPAIAPPASPYGWGDPVINAHFGLKRYQKVLIVAVAGLGSVLLLAFLFRSLLATGFTGASSALSSAPVRQSVLSAETKEATAARMSAGPTILPGQDTPVAPSRGPQVVTVTPGPIIGPETADVHPPQPSLQQPLSPARPHPLAAKRAHAARATGQGVQQSEPLENAPSEPSFTDTPSRSHSAPSSEGEPGGYRIGEENTQDKPMAREPRNASSHRRRSSGDGYRISEKRSRDSKPEGDD